MLTDRLGGYSYYYRVRVESPGYLESDWLVRSGGCYFDPTAVPPGYMWYPSTSGDGSLYVRWGATTTPTPTYVVEESWNDDTFSTPVEVYRGSELETPPLTGRENGTYFYRVMVLSDGYTDSSWLENLSGCVVQVE